MARLLALLWGLMAVLALGLWLGLVATARSRTELLAVVVAADPARPLAHELHAAQDLLFIELPSTRPDPQVLASLWTLLAAGPQADRARNAISRRSETLLASELARARPDQARLRLAYDMAAVLGPEPAAAAHARIAAHAGQRALSAAALTTAADQLRRSPSLEGVRALSDAWQALRHDGSGVDGLTWAARETPPIDDAILLAGDVLREQLDQQLLTVGPDRAVWLRAIWDGLQQLDQTALCSAEQVSRYAAAVRRERIPPLGLAIAVLMAGLLFGGAALAYRRLSRGVQSIDPGAETMEDVDAIDLDTDAVTVQRTTTGEETRVE